MKTKAWQDTSIYQGFVQYVDDSGQEWRRESSDLGIYKFYRLDGGQFVLEGRAVSRRKQAIKALHNLFLNAAEE